MKVPLLDQAFQGQPLLSVIVPVFNERPTIERLLQRLLEAPYPDKEILVVDDGSDDGSAAVLERWTSHPHILVLRHTDNRGKGAAVRTALAHARGVLTILQDADLEYDPDEWPRLIEPLRRGEATVVYGSRYLCPSHPLPWSKFRLAVSLLNGLVRVLYGRRLSDEATCYKAMPTALFRALDLRAHRFELCAEITAKVCRLRLPILEVPISYRPRSAAEGKKIRWRDAWSTVWALLQWRFLPVPLARRSARRLSPRQNRPAAAGRRSGDRRAIGGCRSAAQRHAQLGHL
ncbi:MAG: glycosyltransferase family 2 protein [Gemmataceae bacterium]